MRLPFVSASTYDWAIRHSERLADELEHANAEIDWLRIQVRDEIADRKQYWERCGELNAIIVNMKRENFVVDVPITNTALSVDEADEYAVADEEAKPGLLKRKLGS